MVDEERNSPASPISKESSMQDAAPDELTGGRTSKHRATTSTFRGVCWHRKSRRWQSAINSSGRHVYLGSFDTEEEAARMFDKVAIRVRGPKARINFPYEDYLGPDGQLQTDPRVEQLAAEARKAMLEKQRWMEAQQEDADEAPSLAVASDSNKRRRVGHDSLPSMGGAAAGLGSANAPSASVAAGSVFPLVARSGLGAEGLPTLRGIAGGMATGASGAGQVLDLDMGGRSRPLARSWDAAGSIRLQVSAGSSGGAAAMALNGALVGLGDGVGLGDSTGAGGVLVGQQGGSQSLEGVLLARLQQEQAQQRMLLQLGQLLSSGPDAAHISNEARGFAGHRVTDANPTALQSQPPLHEPALRASPFHRQQQQQQPSSVDAASASASAAAAETQLQLQLLLLQSALLTRGMAGSDAELGPTLGTRDGDVGQQVGRPGAPGPGHDGLSGSLSQIAASLSHQGRSCSAGGAPNGGAAARLLDLGLRSNLPRDAASFGGGAATATDSDLIAAALQLLRQQQDQPLPQSASAALSLTSALLTQRLADLAKPTLDRLAVSAATHQAAAAAAAATAAAASGSVGRANAAVLAAGDVPGVHAGAASGVALLAGALAGNLAGARTGSGSSAGDAPSQALLARFLSTVWEHLPRGSAVELVIPSSNPTLLGYTYTMAAPSTAAPTAPALDYTAGGRAVATDFPSLLAAARPSRLGQAALESSIASGGAFGSCINSWEGAGGSRGDHLVAVQGATRAVPAATAPGVAAGALSTGAGAGVYFRNKYRDLGTYSTMADATQACRSCMGMLLDLTASPQAEETLPVAAAAASAQLPQSPLNAGMAYPTAEAVAELVAGQRAEVNADVNQRAPLQTAPPPWLNMDLGVLELGFRQSKSLQPHVLLQQHAQQLQLQQQRQACSSPTNAPPPGRLWAAATTTGLRERGQPEPRDPAVLVAQLALASQQMGMLPPAQPLIQPARQQLLPVGQQLSGSSAAGRVVSDCEDEEMDQERSRGRQVSAGGERGATHSSCRTSSQPRGDDRGGGSQDDPGRGDEAARTVRSGAMAQGLLALVQQPLHRQGQGQGQGQGQQPAGDQPKQPPPPQHQSNHNQQAGHPIATPDNNQPAAALSLAWSGSEVPGGGNKAWDAHGDGEGPLARPDVVRVEPQRGASSSAQPPEAHDPRAGVTTHPAGLHLEQLGAVAQLMALVLQHHQRQQQGQQLPGQQPPISEAGPLCGDLLGSTGDLLGITGPLLLNGMYASPAADASPPSGPRVSAAPTLANPPPLRLEPQQFFPPLMQHEQLLLSLSQREADTAAAITQRLTLQKSALELETAGRLSPASHPASPELLKRILLLQHELELRKQHPGQQPQQSHGLCGSGDEAEAEAVAVLQRAHSGGSEGAAETTTGSSEEDAATVVGDLPLQV